MLHHFKAPAIPDDAYEEMQRPILRSDNEDIDDWVIDSASYEMTAVKERSLSRYALEQIVVMEDNSKFLLLIHADDDDVFFGGRGKYQEGVIYYRNCMHIVVNSFKALA